MKEIAKEFTGKGEVKGFRFKQLKASKFAYLYEVSDDFAGIWYEVFKRKENKRFYTISYPSSKSFGLWAWSFSDLGLADIKYGDIHISGI